MGYYLLDHPNPHGMTQYRTTRRATVNGQITVHTAESILDLIGADLGAENVASFIAGRLDYGSYHRIGDRDSIVKLAPFDYEVWHDATRYPDGTRANSRSVGISLAMRAADWPSLSAKHRGQLLRSLAEMAVEATQWYRDAHGIDVPARHLTKPESDRGLAGFIGHGERDPGRQSDPGLRFPWEEFLRYYANEMGTTMATDRTDKVKGWQEFIKPRGVYLGESGPNDDGIDGDFGDLTLKGSKWLVEDLENQLTEWTAEVEALEAENVALRAAGALDLLELRARVQAVTDLISGNG